MARTHKGPLAPSQPASRRSSMDSNGGPSTPRATTGGKTMALIPPPRPTGIPKEGRYGVVISDSMRNMLESGSSSKRKHEDEEVVGLKYKFKPSTISSSKPGTLTPNGDGAGGVTVHLEGGNERDVHGFTGKVEKDAPGGGGGDIKEVLVVWDEEEQRFHLRPISHTYTLALDKKLALNALPRTQPAPLHPVYAAVPPTRSPSPTSSTSRSSSPPRPTPQAIPPRAQPQPPPPPVQAPLPTHNPLALPTQSQPPSQAQRAGKRPLPPSAPTEGTSSPPRGRPRVAYGGKTIALPPSTTVGTAHSTSDSDSSNSDASDDDDDFAQMLKQELAREQEKAVAVSTVPVVNGSSSGAGGAVGGNGVPPRPPAGGQVGAKRPPGQVPKSLNAMMGVVDDDEDEDDSEEDSDDN